jgi:hypothetical protein
MVDRALLIINYILYIIYYIISMLREGERGRERVRMGVYGVYGGWGWGWGCMEWRCMGRMGCMGSVGV